MERQLHVLLENILQEIINQIRFKHSEFQIVMELKRVLILSI